MANAPGPAQKPAAPTANAPPITPAQVLRALRRHPRAAIGVFVAVAIAGGVFAATREPVYLASAKGLADRGKFPSDYIKTEDIVPSLDAHMNVLMKQVLGRQTADRLVHKYHLYPQLWVNAESTKGFRSPLPAIERFQAAAAAGAAKSLGDGFVDVSFIHKEPHVAADVANDLLDELREQNRILRKRYANDVFIFVKEAFDAAKHDFDEVTEKRNGYREQNAQSLPEQEALLQGTIARARFEQADAQRALESAGIRLEQVRAELRRMYSELGRSARPRGGGTVAPARDDAPPTPEVATLRAERAKLSAHWRKASRSASEEPSLFLPLGRRFKLSAARA